MSWNYRILAHQTDSGILFQMHEVYCNSQGINDGYSENPVKVLSETPEGITWSLNKMLLARKKPILWAGKKIPAECKIKYKCLLCGRDNFDRKSPHQCNTGMRKRNIEWKIIVT